MAKIKKVIGSNPYYDASDNNGLVILFDDGTVKAFGGATSIAGLLNGDKAAMLIDVPLKDVADIYGNSETVFFVMNDGSVKCFGYNRTRVFGIGISNEYIREFKTIPDIIDVKEIFLHIDSIYNKDATAYILHKDGTVHGCGSNRYGAFGDGTLNDYTEFAILPICSLMFSGSDTNKITKMFVGDSVWYLKEPKEGRVNVWNLFGCGSNTNGKLGVNSTNGNVTTPTSISCSSGVNVKDVVFHHDITFVLTNLESMYYSGNAEAKYGISPIVKTTTVTKSYTPTMMTNMLKHTRALWDGGVWYHLTTGGKVVIRTTSMFDCTGTGDTTTIMGEYYTIPNLDNVVDIACMSGDCAYFLLEDGTVKTCGDNSSGQLGLKDMENRKSVTLIPDLPPIKEMQPINSKAIAFITENDEIYVCGDNTYQSLGLGINENSINIPTTIATESANTSQRYLYLKGNICYTEENKSLMQIASNWSTLADTEKKALFDSATSEVPSVANLRDLGAFKVVAYKESATDMIAPTCRLAAIATDCLVTPKDLISIQRFEGIDKAILTATTSGEGSCKVLVTTDLTTYQSYDFTIQAWKVVDHTDITAIKASGIDAAQLANIPRAAWDTLTAGKNGIGCAYLPIIEETQDICEVDKLQMTVDMKGTWEKI